MTEQEILQVLSKTPSLLPPLSLKVRSVRALAAKGIEADALVEITWADKTYRFICEIATLSSPKTFKSALNQVQLVAKATELAPLVVFPYLKPDQLEELTRLAISGLDLSGNGIIVIPGELFVSRTGQPNRYPADRGIANPYRGAASLVARAFLLKPSYQEVNAIKDELRRRGADIAISTVSKALKVLEEDLLITRNGRRAEVQDPGGIMGRLARSYRAPKAKEARQYRWRGDRQLLFERFKSLAPDNGKRLVVSGAASADRYTVMAREKKLSLYCDSIERTVRTLGQELEQSTVFPDIELIETNDPTAYFDARPSNGLLFASPIQCWLELQAGDPRQSELAQTVKANIFAELDRLRAAQE